ncbi:hypothetical protein MRX96_032319 [Rhipicephalus microplus]
MVTGIFVPLGEQSLTFFESFAAPRPLVENDRLLAWPTEDDVDGAAANVCRLQNAYGLTGCGSPHDTVLSDPSQSVIVRATPCRWASTAPGSERSAATAWVKLGEDQRYTDFFYYHLPEMAIFRRRKANSTSWQAVLCVGKLPSWNPPLVNEGNGSDNQPDTRTAALTWLENVGSARRIYERAAVLTGLTTESAEKLQVLNYAAGGHYSEHIDPLDKAQEQGERLATLLVYLSDVKQGGSTAFPKADLSIRPRRGSALFWFNLKQDPPTSARQIDHSTTHGSCPVLRGSKWIATLWMHEWSQPWDLDYSLS